MHDFPKCTVTTLQEKELQEQELGAGAWADLGNIKNYK